MNSHTDELLRNFWEELNCLLEAETVEEALYWLIAYLHNGLKILSDVISRFEDRN